jgi:hypothetical protein
MPDLDKKRPTTRYGRRQYDWQRALDRMWETALTLGPDGLRAEAEGDPAREALLAALRQPSDAEMINVEALGRAVRAESEARRLRVALAYALNKPRDRKGTAIMARRAAHGNRKDPHTGAVRIPTGPAAA